MTQFGSQVQTAVHVRLASAAALATCTYSSASSVLPSNTDLGAKLVATSNGALTIDGVAAVVDDEVLIKDQVTTLQNGVYRVRSIGGTSSTWSLERSKQARDSGQFDGMLVSTGPEGSANASVVYLYSGVTAPVIGTNAITYADVTGTDLSAYVKETQIGFDDPGVAIPLTGNTVSTGGPQLISLTGIVPAGTLAALTLNFIDGISNGLCIITCTQVITALTVTGNVNKDATRIVLATPSALTLGQVMIWAWDESSSTACWIRLQ